MKIKHFKKGHKEIVESGVKDLYHYTTYIGKHKIHLPAGDSIWLVEKGKMSVYRKPGFYKSKKMTVVIRGYAPEERSSTFETISNLSYVNGCSSNQLINPTRVGDPTAQLLYLPKYTQEQAHHIHPTTRVVFILKGTGVSIQGMKGHSKKVTLNKGDVIILDKMVPHHFETKDSELIVLPIHIYSSTELEFKHPMMLGTHSVE